MREVYHMVCLVVTEVGGSSPLARGLRCHWGPLPRRRRIIPARAGFTPGAPSRRRPCADQPRSRGVYQIGHTIIENNLGSSPLARGLRQRLRLRHHHPGIIPARAGFTDLQRGPGVRGRDHPRSRGVYPVARRVVDPLEGSSPLARGLLGPPWGTRAVARIIPARAGFTVPGRGALGRGL